jgi:hypothetical protein
VIKCFLFCDPEMIKPVAEAKNKQSHPKHDSPFLTNVKFTEHNKIKILTLNLERLATLKSFKIIDIRGDL